MVASEKRIAELEGKQKSMAAATPAPGVESLASGGAESGASDGDSVAEWNTAVAAEVAKGRTKAKAISGVAKANPELHHAYVQSVNMAAKRPLGRFA